MTRFLDSKKLQILVIVTLTTLAYSNIFTNQFIEDDVVLIADWPVIRDLKLASLTLTRDVRQFLPETRLSDYRPIRTISLALIYGFSKDNPVGYHIAAILIHVINTVLVYLIIIELLRVLPRKAFPPLPFVTALLFGLHPVHTEAVTYTVVGIANLSSTLLFASFLLFLRSSDRRIDYFYIGSVAAATLAFFTYDFAVILPVLLLLYDFCFGKFKKNSLKRRIFKHIPYWLSLAFYIFMRFYIAHFSYIKNFEFLAGSFYITMLNQLKMFVWYIFLVFFPLKLSFVHTIADGVETYINPYSNLDSISKSTWSVDILGSILILAMVIGIAIWSFKQYPLISFCIGWFFISLLPVANIIPAGPLLSERYLYVPSFGFVLVVGYLLSKIFNLRSFPSEKQFSIFNYGVGRFLVITLVVTIALAYGIRTYVRNFDWKSGETFWASVIFAYPKSILGHYNLALFQEQNNPDSAINTYERLLEIEPRFWEARFNLANLYFAFSNYSGAEEEYKNVLNANADFLDVYYNLALLYKDQNRDGLVLETLTKALNIDPSGYKLFYTVKSKAELHQGYANVFNLMGLVFEEQGKLSQAVSSFSQAYFYNPTNLQVKSNIENFIKKYPFFKNFPLNFESKDGKIQYALFGNYMFGAMQDWRVYLSGTNSSINDTNLNITLALDSLGKNETFEDYLARQNDLGKIVQEGLAQIPNVDEAYVKIWTVKDEFGKGDINKWQFFLHRGSRVIVVLVYDIDQSNKQDFDNFLSSVLIM